MGQQRLRAEDVVRDYRQQLWENQKKELAAAAALNKSDPDALALIEAAGPESFQQINDMNDRDLLMEWAEKNPNLAPSVVGWQSFQSPGVWSGIKKGVGGMFGGAVGEALERAPNWTQVGDEVDYSLGDEAVAPWSWEHLGQLGGRLAGEGALIAGTGGAALPVRGAVYGALSGGAAPWTASSTRLAEGSRGFGGKALGSVINAPIQAAGYGLPLHNATLGLSTLLNAGAAATEQGVLDSIRGTKHNSIPLALGGAAAVGAPMRGIAWWKGVQPTLSAKGAAAAIGKGAWQGVRHPMDSATAVREAVTQRAIPTFKASMKWGATPESVTEAVKAATPVTPVASHAQPKDVFVNPNRTPEAAEALWNSIPEEDRAMARAQGFGPEELADLFSVSSNKRVSDLTEVLDPSVLSRGFKRFGNQTRMIIDVEGQPIEGRIVGQWDPQTTAGRELGAKGRFIFLGNDGNYRQLNGGHMIESTRWMPVENTNGAVRLDPGWIPVAKWGKTIPAPAEGIAIVARHPEGRIRVIKADDPTKWRDIEDPREVGLDPDWFNQQKALELAAKEEKLAKQKELEQEMALGRAQAGSKPNQKIPTLGSMKEDALARMRGSGRKLQEYVHTGYRESTGAEPPAGFPGIIPPMPAGPTTTATRFPVTAPVPAHSPTPSVRPQPSHATPQSPNRRAAAIRRITELQDVSDPVVLMQLLRDINEGR